MKVEFSICTQKIMRPEVSIKLNKKDSTLRFKNPPQKCTLEVMSPELLIKSNNKDSKLKVKKTKKTICTQKVIRLEVSIKSNDKYLKHMVNKTKKTSDTKFKKAKMKINLFEDVTSYSFV